MKTKNIFSVLMFSAILLFGCQKESCQESYTMLRSTGFVAGIEQDSPETKTSLDEGLSVLWNKGDQVSLFTGTESNRRMQVDDDAEGRPFSRLNDVQDSDPGTMEEIYAVAACYPYAEDAGIVYSPGTFSYIFSLKIPSTQTWAKGSFGKGAFPMMAVSREGTDTLAFKNLFGALKLQIKGTASIASISFQGNNGETVCGDVRVSAAEGLAPSILSFTNAGKTVTLDCPGGVQLSSSNTTDFYIALPPTTFSEGFTVSVTDVNGEVTQIKSSKEQKIKRSKVLAMPAVTVINRYNGHDYVDLGLTSGLKWATVNVGASSQLESGTFFAWGEVEGKSTYSLDNYSWYSDGVYTKYGASDIPTTLRKADEAAIVAWGGEWSMPTFEDFNELVAECDCSWGSKQEKVNKKLLTIYGVTFTSKSDNTKSIFLPAYLYGDEDGPGKSGGTTTPFGYYWSNTRYDGGDARTLVVSSGNNYAYTSKMERYRGLMIRPVVDIHVLEVTLSESSASMFLGSGSITLTATIEPSNARNKDYVWQSSNTDVATVSSDGVVTAVGEGECDITAVALDRGVASLPCHVTVTDLASKSVDLGLTSGNLWATCNLGADSEGEIGNYYSWGETAPKTAYSLSSYSLYSDGAYTKYTKSGSILQKADDAVTAAWGEEWGMPTKEDFEELLSECNVEKSSMLVNKTTLLGLRVTSKSNGNSIFLPSMGYRSSSATLQNQTYGYYWSSTSSDGGNASAFQINTSTGAIIPFSRECGMLVRPVHRQYVKGVIVLPTTAELYYYENRKIATTQTLAATAIPATASNRAVDWQSSDTAVATVDENGLVTAAGIGECDITAVSKDHGTVSNACHVTVKDPFNGYNYVDLGLPSGLLWATKNLRANGMTKLGYYYQWGSTRKSSPFNEDTYQLADKYNSTDGLTRLTKEDDSASQEMGGLWRIPTMAEYEELLNNAIRVGIWSNGLEFYFSNGNSIFFPYTGWMDGYDQKSGGGWEMYTNSASRWYSTMAYYWTSDLKQSSTNKYAYCFMFYYYTYSHSTIFYHAEKISNLLRYRGLQIRPVCGPRSD